MTRKIKFLSVLIMLCLASVVWAQPPGGGGVTSGGGGLPLGDIELPDVNVDIPDIEDIDLDIQGDIDVDARTAEILATAAVSTQIDAVQDMDFDANTFSPERIV